MKTLVELLIAGRAVIALPEHWTHGALARDVDGNRVRTDAPDAVRFSSLGALSRSGAPTWNDPGWVQAARALNAAMRPGVAAFDSNHAHVEVINAWDRAIATAQAVPA